MSNLEKTMQEQMEQIAAATGWEAEKVEAAVDHAKKLGISLNSYVRYEGWKLDEESLAALGKKLKMQAKKRKENVAEVCAETGWDEATAKERIKQAKKRLNITSTDYVANGLWYLSTEELPATLEEARKAVTRCRENIGMVSEATGWSFEKAKAEMDHAKKLGMTYYRYAHNQVWNLTDDEIIQLAQKLEQQAEKRNENLNTVCQETGWDAKTAKKQMDQAKKRLSVTTDSYVRNELWLLDAEEIPTTMKAAKKAAAKRKKYMEIVCAATGWSKGEALSQMRKALKAGVTNYYYTRYQAWQLNDEEIAELSVTLVGLKQKKLEDNEWYIKTISEKAGKSCDEVRADMEQLRKMKGVSYLKYAQKECYNREDAGLDALAAFLKEDKKRIRANKNKYVEQVCAITGWLPAKAELEIAKAKLNCGSSYEDYVVFKLYELTPEEQRKYVTYGLFSKMRIKYNQYFRSRKYFDDKAMFNRTFSDCINRRWFVNWDLPYEEFLKQIDGLDAVLVKPLTATQGIGIQKFQCNVEDKRALYDTIMALPDSIIEQYVIQHPAVMAFCDTSVNTLRITTLNYNGECKFLYSVFRMGQGKVVDNFHAGGIAATVDVNTGIVVTHAADLSANVYPVNPYSGLAMKGFKIPNWDKIIETCQKSFNKVPGVNLIGWDFAITPDGVDLIEGNPGASYVVAQIPNVADRIGLRAAMVDPYL